MSVLLLLFGCCCGVDANDFMFYVSHYCCCLGGWECVHVGVGCVRICMCSMSGELCLQVKYPAMIPKADEDLRRKYKKKKELWPTDDQAKECKRSKSERGD